MKIRMVYLICIVFSYLFVNYCYAQENIKICADDNIQVPFIMVKNGKTFGVHIDILNDLFKNSELTYTIELIPWHKCLEKAKLGEFDVVLNASYDPKRSEFLYYPKDSGENEPFPCESVFKLGCFGYFVLTLKEFSFDYTGDPLKLPTPIRVAKGNSAEKELLTMKNINLEIGKSDILNIKKMIIDNSGSAIVYSALLNSIQGNSKISSKIKIHKVPYKIKSYYLAFSKLTKINNENINFIWEKLSKIINNSDKMRKYFKKYHLSYEIKN